MPAARTGRIVEVPCEANGWRWVIETPLDGRMYLSGPGAPQGGQVGDEGSLTYQGGSSWGLWFWRRVSRCAPTCGTCR